MVAVTVHATATAPLLVLLQCARPRRLVPPSARCVPLLLLHEAATLCAAVAAVAVTVPPPPPLLLQGLHTFLREQGRNSRQLATTTSSRTAYTVN